MCSASCNAVGTQAMPPSNQPIFNFGWRSRIPEKTYLANCSRNESTLTIMPTTTLLFWHGVLGGVSPMWWLTGTSDSSISSQTASISVLP